MPVSKERKDAAWGTTEKVAKAPAVEARGPAVEVRGPAVEVRGPGTSLASGEGDGAAGEKAATTVVEEMEVAGRDNPAGEGDRVLPVAMRAKVNVHAAKDPRGAAAGSVRAVGRSCPRWSLNSAAWRRWRRPLPRSRPRMKKKGSASRAGRKRSLSMWWTTTI